jgi:hypothetical protein
MSEQFDMKLFLASVLIGSHATRQRHLRQATLIQAEIQTAGSESRLGAGRESIWLGF